MSGFLYFRPGSSLVRLDEARRLGLGYAFDGGSPACVNGVTGPDDATGTIFGDRKRFKEKNICYLPSEQKWRKIPRPKDSTPVWIGWYTSYIPTPDDLARPKIIDGGKIVLNDGNTWTIPCVRKFDEAFGFKNHLPRVIDQDDEGNWIYGGILPQHEKLWDAVGRFLEQLCKVVEDGSAEEYMITDELDAVALLLSANYVIDKTEIAALGLMNEDLIFEVLKIASDWQTFIDWSESKKNELDQGTQSIEAGQQAG
ncbi:hypothetical protein EH220_03050 [bacterium]|nr:MAG: hypothetical protein EH220_03050 [bacterium]